MNVDTVLKRLQEVLSEGYSITSARSKVCKELAVTHAEERSLMTTPEYKTISAKSRTVRRSFITKASGQ